MNAVRRAYPEVPGMADYCVYWFRRAQEALPECTARDSLAGRAGLVGTQNIRNNQSRVGGLDYITKSGTIVEAVENQPWSGEANVHVSIANWVKTRDSAILPDDRRLWFKVEKGSTPTPRKRGQGPASKQFEINVRTVAYISSALSDQTDISRAERIWRNSGVVVCQGITPGSDGFVINAADRSRLIAADEASARVIHPYLVGRELTASDGTPSRFIIDLGGRTILESQEFRAAFQHLHRNVLPFREGRAKAEAPRAGAHTAQIARWWMHWRPRTELMAVLESLPRYLACSRVTKRPIFVFIDSRIRPGDALQVFGFADDYSFGILQSRAHWLWFTTKCSKLKSDYRYTPESVFETFPWPQCPTTAQIGAVAKAGRSIRRVRRDALKKVSGGLRTVYRTLEMPGKNPLRDAHAALDAAVLAACGFSAKKDLLSQLLKLNLDTASRIATGQTVVAPGIPSNYRRPERLTTDDCVRPN